MTASRGGWTAAAVAFAAILVALCAAAVCPAYLNHDAAWYLWMAGAWLDGATLYRDVVDTNPPLIVYLTAIPVWLGRALHASDVQVFKACVFLLGACSIAGAVTAVRRIAPTGWAMFALTTALTFALFPFVKGDFGQREHIAVLLIMPWVLSSVAWSLERPLPLATEIAFGVAAGLGFSLKPHFAIAWLGCEIAVIVVRHSAWSWLRPATVAVVATAVFYVGFVVIFVPDYRLVARDALGVYGGLNAPASTLLRLPDLLIGLAAVAIGALAPLGRNARTTSIVLFSVAAGFLLAALLQRKGWPYQLYPFRAFAIMYFAAVGAGLMEEHAATLQSLWGAGQTVLGAAAAVALIWSARAVTHAHHAAGSELVTALIAAIRAEEPVASVAVLNMRWGIFPAFPAVNYSHVRWTLRYNALWFMPGLYQAELTSGRGEIAPHPPSAMSWLERRFFAHVADDLCAQPPQLLMVEPPPPEARAGQRALDLLRYYGQDPKVARLLTHYRAVSTAGPFTIYRPTPLASCAPP